MRQNKILVYLSGIIALSHAAALANDALGDKFAPTLQMSSPGMVGVDLKANYPQYPYTDYLPMAITDMMRHDLAKRFTFGVAKNKDFGITTCVGEGFVSFDCSEYAADTTNNSLVEKAYLKMYQDLNLKPTVYYQVFENPFRPQPFASQYWFYYFNNDWASDHLGDWESMTVFADQKEQGKEAAYSTHYEARRHSYRWAGAPPVYIANGGHGSYADKGTTLFKIVNDNHEGDGIGTFSKTNSVFSNLKHAQSVNFLDGRKQIWTEYKDRWGVGEAPHGPAYRRDAVNSRFFATQPPYDPYDNCAKINLTQLFGTSKTLPDFDQWMTAEEELKLLIENIVYFGPWKWASHYALDSATCQPIDTPVAVKNLKVTGSDGDTRLQLTWQDLPFDSTVARPFGYNLVLTQANNREWLGARVIPASKSCDNAGSCQAEFVLDRPYDKKTHCVRVESWNSHLNKNSADACGAPEVAFVIDDTGSMEDEIARVRNALTRYINSQNPEQPVLMQLVTFKDNATQRLVTDDAAAMRNAVANLYADGGDYCPESFGTGLSKAVYTVVDGGKIITATDADDNSGSLLAQAKREMQRRGIQQEVYLTGNCEYSYSRSLAHTVSNSFELLPLQTSNGAVPPEQQSGIAPAMMDVDYRWQRVLLDDHYSDIEMEDSPERLERHGSGFQANGYARKHYIGQSWNKPDLVDWDKQDWIDTVVYKGVYVLNFSVTAMDPGDKLKFSAYRNYGERTPFATATITSPGHYYMRLEQDENTHYEFFLESNLKETGAIEYMVRVDEDPFTGSNRSPQDMYKQLADDTGGKFYYNPEAGYGDPNALQELEDKIYESLVEVAQPHIRTLSPREVTQGDTNVAFSVTGARTHWNAQAVVTLRSKDGVTTVYTTHLVAEKEGLTFNANFPRSLPVGEYDLIVNLLGETLTYDNAVTVLKNDSPVFGDLNHDGVVDCKDIDIVNAALRSKIGDANYNAEADINKDGKISVFDLSSVARELPIGLKCS